jgi:tmRNA-binding protein
MAKNSAFVELQSRASQIKYPATRAKRQEARSMVDKKENSSKKIIAVNRKARFDYFIVDEYEAGLVLKGTEVKSLRIGKANLKDAYAKVQNGEVFIYQDKRENVVGVISWVMLQKEINQGQI